MRSQEQCQGRDEDDARVIGSQFAVERVLKWCRAARTNRFARKTSAPKEPSHSVHTPALAVKNRLPARPHDGVEDNRRRQLRLQHQLLALQVRLDYPDTY